MHAAVWLLVAPAVLGARQFLPYSECVSKGYLAGQLSCNTCAELEVIVGKNDAIATDCRSCCSPAIDMALPTRYDSAKLNVRSCVANRRGILRTQTYIDSCRSALCGKTVGAGLMNG